MLWRRRQLDARKIGDVLVMHLAALATIVAVSSYGYQWWAGHTYGPRYKSGSLPYLIPLAYVGAVMVLSGADSRGTLRVGIVGLMAWSLLIHWQGGWFHSTVCWNADIDTNPRRVWSVSDPQITSGFRDLITEGPKHALIAACLSDTDVASDA